MRQVNQQHGSEPAHSLRPWRRLSVKRVPSRRGDALRGGCGGWAHLQAPSAETRGHGRHAAPEYRPVTALAVDPALHAQAQRSLDSRSAAYLRIKGELLTIRNEVLLTTPTYTLTDFDPATRTARLMVLSDGPGAPGELYHVPRALIDPMRWTFRLRQLLAFADPPA